ncbi:hypothetical protein LCGC14_0145330 [marine sediment metagenome]|uniref:Uncharacterized protein n=1 Tax=marine sediment metagenome TaxID=412755 RepID=A0A0F9Y1A6_9ZZZZ
MSYKKQAEVFQELRELVKKYNVTVVTAIQPRSLHSIPTLPDDQEFIFIDYPDTILKDKK